MPEAREAGRFLVAPGEMTILTIKLLWENFEREKNARHGGRNRLAR